MFTYSLSGLEIKTSPEETEEVEENETTARSAVYQVLGAFFSPPDRDHYDKARAGLWAKELTEAAALLPFSLEVAALVLGDEVDPVRYDAQYARAFPAGCGEAAFGPDRDDQDRQVLEAQLRREYDYFGLSVGEGGRQTPDHLCSECDFMQYLAFREAATGSERLRASYRRAERDFLVQHLLSWVPAMVRATAALEPAPHLRWGIAHLEMFLRSDREYLTGLLGA